MAQPAALASDFSETLAKAAEEGGEAVLQLLARLLGRLGEIPGAWIRTERAMHHLATAPLTLVCDSCGRPLHGR